MVPNHQSRFFVGVYTYFYTILAQNMANRTSYISHVDNQVGIGKGELEQLHRVVTNLAGTTISVVFGGD